MVLRPGPDQPRAGLCVSRGFSVGGFVWPSACWRFFDFDVRAEIPLSELPRVRPTAPPDRILRIAFERCRSDHYTDSLPPLRAWGPGPATILQGWSADATVLCVPGLGYFWVHPYPRRVVCHADPAADPDAVRHFLLNQVLPRLVSVDVPLTIHAGGVVTSEGAIALAGPSGVGKSTLAASFDQSGDGVAVSDDSVILRVGADGPRLIGSYPGCRLRPDSADALAVSVDGMGAERSGTHKRWMAVRAPAGYSAPARVAGVFVLSEWDGHSSGVSLLRLSGTEALRALIRNAFVLDDRDSRMIASRMAEAAALLHAGPAVYSLSYPRGHAVLPDVRAAILSAIRDAACQQSAE
jgi:hypothetical protein